MPTGRIYSVGYEGLTLVGLVERLSQSRVTLLVDVRLTPASRRPGFSRRALASALDSAGIEYIHEPDLGNPPENRESFRNGDGAEGRARMKALLANGSGPALTRLVERARGSRVAVLCVERAPTRCHRQVITEMALKVEPQLEVLDLL